MCARSKILLVGLKKLFTISSLFILPLSVQANLSADDGKERRVAIVFPPASGQVQSDAEAGLSHAIDENWWTQILQNIKQREYHISWRDKHDIQGNDDKRVYQAPNRAHKLLTYFTKDGIRIVPRTAAAEQPSWRWGLSLDGYVIDDRQAHVDAATRNVQGNRIEYRRKGLVEWYVNTAQGLEQGFTLLTPPGNQPGSNLTLSFTMSGNLEARIGGKGESVHLYGQGPGGAQVLEFGHLKAFDANGVDLPIHFELAQRGLNLQVASADAVYPITIDPMLTSSASHSAFGGQADSNLGAAVALAGDVNGDGYSDVIVGAPFYYNSVGIEGAVFVYHGSLRGLATTASWSAFGGQYDANLGASVASAGDVNDDGFDDVIVGAPGFDNPLANEGAAFVYLGSASGLSATADWEVYGGQVSPGFAGSVASAGDVNGDGYDDVIVGAPFYDINSLTNTNEGALFVYYGSATGPSATADRSIISGQAGALLGMSVASAGDVNNDGFDDVIAGAPFYDNTFVDGGGLFVYSGSAGGLSATPGWNAFGDKLNAGLGETVASAGDVNGDGYSDVISGAPYYVSDTLESEGGSFVYHGSASGLSATADWSAYGGDANALFGASVSSAGDVNGDGYSDIIIGARGYSSAHLNEGAAIVYLGAAAGLSVTSDWSVLGGQAEAGFGGSAAAAGDVDGNGYDDVIVGAELYDGTATNEGASFVYMSGVRKSGGGGSLYIVAYIALLMMVLIKRSQFR